MAMLERRMIDVHGATLEIFEGGAQGPLVCEAHPYGGYTGQRSDQDHLLDHVRLVQVNGRGAGHSSPGHDTRDYTFDRFVLDLEAVRWQLGGEPWIFVSHSAGVYAAVHYALKYPRGLRGMITGFLGPDLRKIVDDHRSIVNSANPAYEQLLAAMPRPSSPDGASQFTGWAQAGDAMWLWYEHDRPVCVYPFALPAYRRAYMSEMLTNSVENCLDTITVPTLTFAGRYDPLAPLGYVEVLRNIPGSEFVVLECGHADMDEGYDFVKYCVAVQQFLTERLGR